MYTEKKRNDEWDWLVIGGGSGSTHDIIRCVILNASTCGALRDKSRRRRPVVLSE